MQVSHWCLFPCFIVLFCSVHSYFSTDETKVYKFTKKQYTVYIEENAPVRTFCRMREMIGVYIPPESSSNRVSFKVESGDQFKRFRAEAHPIGNFVFLKLRTRGASNYVINREHQPFFNLTVRLRVTNSHQSSRANILVVITDVDDSPPMLNKSSYTEFVDEDSKIGKPILTVRASDDDIGLNGQIYYSIQPPLDEFEIDPVRGTISVAMPLDYDAKSVYKSNVIADDRGIKKRMGSSLETHSAGLTIYVHRYNKNDPRLELVKLPAVVEHGLAGTVYAIISAYDDDRGSLKGKVQSVSIIDGDPQHHFTVKRSSDPLQWVVVIRNSLDREDMPNGYNLTLKAQDGGDPPRKSTLNVNVRIVDTNDCNPQFDFAQYTFVMSPFAPRHSLVGIVHATDKDLGSNGELVYSLETGSNGRFYLESKTGRIFRSTKPIDANTDWTLRIKAADKGHLGLKKFGYTTVTVKVFDGNLHRPSFANMHELKVSEGLSVGSFITNIHVVDADKGDNGKLLYQLLNRKDVPFDIGVNNGSLFTTHELDFETQKHEFTAIILAQDLGSPYSRSATTTLQIRVEDINDNAPRMMYKSCDIIIPRNALVNDSVLRVQATDVDSKHLTYKISRGNDLGLFYLDMGANIKIADMWLRNPSFVDLEISASDGKYETSTKVSIGPGKKFTRECRPTDAQKTIKPSGIFAEDYTPTYVVQTERRAHNAPVFTTSGARYAAVPEDVKVGTSILDLSVLDPDPGYDGSVVFAIVDGDKNGRFNISYDVFSPEPSYSSAKLIVAAPLDRELYDSYSLTLVASDLDDSQEGPNTVKAIIHVMIDDVNDNRPTFKQRTTTVHVPENTHVGKIIATVRAEDPDENENGTVVHSIPNDIKEFTIVPDTGEVKIAQPLDRERKDKYVIKIRAADNSKVNSLASHTTLIVEVTDVNDNPPEFAQDNFFASVREDFPLGAVVYRIEATDNDLGEGGRISYALESHDDTFFINRITGSIRINRLLDFEEKQSYILKVIASDAGSPLLSSSARLHLSITDVNENIYAPFFRGLPNNLATAKIQENLPPGSLVRKFDVADKDQGTNGDVELSILEGSGLGRFAIDSQGNLETLEVFDRESTPSYWLTVVARDRAPVPLDTFLFVYVEIVDENDNAPMPSEPVFVTGVLENSKENSFVIEITAQDNDRGDDANLHYVLNDSPSSKYFKIDSNSGVMQTSDIPLDRERDAVHIVEVSIYDRKDPRASDVQVSIATVFVQVQDLNDNAPTMRQNIIEQNLPATSRLPQPLPVYRVLATDNDEGINRQLLYSMDVYPTNFSKHFSIDRRTGWVYLTKPLNLSHTDLLKLDVNVADGGTPSHTALAQIFFSLKEENSTNQKPLIISKSGVTSVDEDCSLYNFIYRIDVDKNALDPSLIWYNFSEGNEDNTFSIDKNYEGAGIIILAEPLDYERKREYNLVITAYNVYYPSAKSQHKLLVRINDVNDNRPQFNQSQYFVDISEDFKISLPIIRTVAADRDSEHSLQYSLPHASSKRSLDLFRIDNQGQLFLKSAITKEAMRQHQLLVKVKESKKGYFNYAYITVMIFDVNNHKPVFSDDLYEVEIPEFAPANTTVIRVLATDQDKDQNAQITYSIAEEGSSWELFIIDPLLGFVKSKVSFEGKVGSVHELTIVAKDSGTPSLKAETKIIFKITLDDNSLPVFERDTYIGDIDENMPVGTKIVKVKAKSSSTVEYAIESGKPHAQHFIINPVSGTVSSRILLDYEYCSSYTLIITAVNLLGHSVKCQVRIRVNDVNDNHPKFTKTEYAGFISESAALASLVYQPNTSIPLYIEAKDKDSGPNSRITYFIDDVIAEEYFVFDQTTLELRTRKYLDREKMSEIVFGISAQDSGNPPLHVIEQAFVTIQILDVNDCVPQFTEKTFSTTLRLPTFPNVHIFQLSAEDADLHSTLTYSLLSYKHLFQVHHKTGMVSVNANAKSKDFSNNYSYSVKATVSDGVHNNSGIINIKTSTIKFNRNFRIEDSQMHLVLQENSYDKLDLGAVVVSGAHAVKPFMRFSILNPSKYVEIGSVSGMIRSTGVPIDRELVSQINLQIKVSNSKYSNEDAVSLVTILVDDVNDNAPVFLKLPYFAVIKALAPPKTFTRKVFAKDVDAGDNAKLEFSLDDPNGHFSIDRNSGDVTLKKSFSTDEEGIDYKFKVIASDKGSPSLSSIVPVTVRVMNRAAPLFKPFTSINVTENTRVGTSITKLVAESQSGTSDLYYSIEKGNREHNFNIDYDTGVVTVENHLDYETSQKVFVLTIRATDVSSSSYTDAQLTIHLLDENDNYPRFESKMYEVSFLESNIIGTPVLTISATDADSDGKQLLTYSMLNSTAKKYFTIGEISGVISTISLLDYETIKRFEFEIQATDGKLTDIASVVVNLKDTKDNPPLFQQTHFHFIVSERAPVGHIIGKPVAFDPDVSDHQLLMFNLFENTADLPFAINKSTGMLYKVKYDKPMKTNYDFKIEATDGVFSSKCSVSVTVNTANRHPPKVVENQKKNVFENTAEFEHKPFYKVQVDDPDEGTMGELFYTIESDHLKSIFRIDYRTGNLYLLRALDREESPLYTIPLAIQDGGGITVRTNVIVTVMDRNDNPPQFLRGEYRASLPFNSNAGTILTLVETIDLDKGFAGKVKYSLYSDQISQISEAFTINNATGVLSTLKSSSDLLKTPGSPVVFQFFVRATDYGTPPLQSDVPVEVILLGEDDVQPSFSTSRSKRSLNNKYITIPEDAPFHYFVDFHNVSSSRPVTYSIVTPPSWSPLAEWFSINSTGHVIVASQLDYETASRVDVVICAENDNYPSLTDYYSLIVEISDVNDNTPVFLSEQYFAVLPENTVEGTFVIKVHATDADQGANGRVTYQMKHGSSVFSLDPSNGDIRLRAPLDREVSDFYDLFIIASDSGTPLLTSECSLHIEVADVNDNKPYFKNLRDRKFSVSEAADIGTPVVTLYAEDNDIYPNDVIRYSIIDVVAVGKFIINETTGVISVFSKLDREEHGIYHLNVSASDGLFSTFITIDIVILDDNDNEPRCAESSVYLNVSEAAHINQDVYQVFATDQDLGDNAKISYYVNYHDTHITQPFAIRANGFLFVNEELDREKESQFLIWVFAADNDGKSCVTQISINILDVNDNFPTFQGSYRVAISEDAKIGSVLMKPTAVDNDYGDNGTTFYELDGSQESQYFEIDKDSGLITLKEHLDSEKSNTLNFRVQARDKGNPPLLSYTSISVSVLDVNDNPPQFEKDAYECDVLESIAVNSQLLTVKAWNVDAGETAQIYYSIISGNDDNLFKIDMNGTLELIASLDYDTKQHHYLTVLATEEGIPMLLSETSVVVNVIDINDNEPRFNQETYDAVVSENLQRGSKVLRMQAVDRDGPEFSRITYSIFEGNKFGHFAVDESEGWLTVKSTSLDRETVSNYILKVKAEDNGVPPKSATAAVSITVSDINDNPPRFSKDRYTIKVHQAIPANHKLMKFDVSDDDSPMNGPPFRFSVIGNSASDVLFVESDGTMRTKREIEKFPTGLNFKVKVTDSGKPSQSSEVPVVLETIPHGQYPPEISSHHFRVLVPEEDEFPGGFIGKLDADDRDKHDVLEFSWQSKKIPGFTITKNGSVFVDPGLDDGLYRANVSVTDGYFTANTSIKFEVDVLTQEALRNAFNIRYLSTDADAFYPAYAEILNSKLCDHLDYKNLEVKQLGIQSFEGNDVDYLIAVQMAESKEYIPPKKLYDAMTLMLKKSKKSVVIDVGDYFYSICNEERCSTGSTCRSKVESVMPLLFTVSNQRNRFTSLKFEWSYECVCKPGYHGVNCSIHADVCEENRCPDVKRCIPTFGGQYTCVCPDGRSGPRCEKRTYQFDCQSEKCKNELDKDPISLTGSGYVQYSINSIQPTNAMDITFSLRTTAEDGVVFFAHGFHDFLCVALRNGLLEYVVKSQGGTTRTIMDFTKINDGKWHYVSVVHLGRSDRMVIDRSTRIASTGNKRHSMIYLNSQEIYVGGITDDFEEHATDCGDQTRKKGSLIGGFQGCIDDIYVNGVLLPRPNDDSQSEEVEIKHHQNIQDGCGAAIGVLGACCNNPCLNGATCIQTESSKGFECQCQNGFNGTRCDYHINPCAEHTCRNGGVCKPLINDYACECPADLSGQFCQTGLFCADHECYNGGICRELSSGSKCHCPNGFHGDLCELKKSSCAPNPCYNGGKCQPIDDKTYKCTCLKNSTGADCSKLVMSYSSFAVFVDSYFIHIIISFAILFVLIFLVAVIILCCCCKKRSKSSMPPTVNFNGTQATIESPTRTQVVYVRSEDNTSYPHQPYYQSFISTYGRNGTTLDPSPPPNYSRTPPENPPYYRRPPSKVAEPVEVDPLLVTVPGKEPPEYEDGFQSIEDNASEEREHDHDSLNLSHISDSGQDTTPHMFSRRHGGPT